MPKTVRSIRLECHKGSSNKFYEIKLEEKLEESSNFVGNWSTIARWGRIGTNGQSKNYLSLVSKKTATAKFMELLETRELKGYEIMWDYHPPTNLPTIEEVEQKPIESKGEISPRARRLERILDTI